jgi:hypothetical protein
MTEHLNATLPDANELVSLDNSGLNAVVKAVAEYVAFRYKSVVAYIGISPLVQPGLQR